MKVGHTRIRVIEDRRTVRDGTVSPARRTTLVTGKKTVLAARYADE